MSSKSLVKGVVETLHEKNTRTASEKKKFEEFQKQKSLGSSPSKPIPMNSSKYDGKGFMSPSKIPRKISPRSNSADVGNSKSPPSRPALVKANTTPISIPASVASSIYGFPQVDDNVIPEENNEEFDYSAIQPTSSELDDIEHSNAYLNAMDFEASASDISDNDESILSPAPLKKKAPFTKKTAINGGHDLSDIALIDGEYEDTPKVEVSNSFNDEEDNEPAEPTIAELCGDNLVTDAETSNDGIDRETVTVRTTSEVTMERRREPLQAERSDSVPVDEVRDNEPIESDSGAAIASVYDPAVETSDPAPMHHSNDRHNDASINDAESTYPESEITEAVASTVAALESSVREERISPKLQVEESQLTHHQQQLENEQQQESDEPAPEGELCDDIGLLTADALVDYNPPDPATAFDVNVQRQSSRSSLMYSPMSQVSDAALTSDQHPSEIIRTETDSVLTVESYKSDMELLGIEKIDLNGEMMMEDADNKEPAVIPAASVPAAVVPSILSISTTKSAEKTQPKPNVKFSPTANAAGIATSKPTKSSPAAASVSTPTTGNSSNGQQKDMRRSYSCGVDDYNMGDIYQQANSPDNINKRTPPSGANGSSKRGSGAKNGRSPPSGSSSSGGRVSRQDLGLTTITTITNTPQGSFQNTFTVKRKPNYETFNSPIKHKISPLRQADAFAEKPRPAVIINAHHDPKANLVFLMQAAVIRMQMAYSRQLFYRWKVKVLRLRQTVSDMKHRDYSPADAKRVRLATALSSRDGKVGLEVVERTDEEVEQYGNAHIRRCLDTIFRLFGKLENESSYQYNASAAVPDETVNTSTTYDPGVPLEDLDTSVISTDHDTSTLITTSRKNNITTTITTVKKLNYTRYDRMRGRVINCHSAKRGFHCWKKYVNGIAKIEYAVPPSLRLMLLCTQDQLWKIFVPFLPAKVGVPSDHWVEDASTGLMQNTKYKKRLMEFEAVWNMLREIKICPLLVGKVRLADYFHGVVRDFHPPTTATGGSPDKNSGSPSATTPVSRLQPTTPTSANATKGRGGSAAATNGSAQVSSADKRSKSPNRTAAGGAAVNSKAQPGLRQSFVSPDGCKIRLTLFANEMTSVTGKEYAAPVSEQPSTTVNSEVNHATKTPQRPTNGQSHVKVTPSTTVKEIDLSHIHSAIISSTTANHGSSTNHAGPASLSLITFQKLLWRIAVDCLLPRDEMLAYNGNAASSTAVTASVLNQGVALTPLEHFTSLAYEEQRGLLEWYFALMMGTKRSVVNQDILKLLKNISIYDEKKSKSAR